MGQICSGFGHVVRELNEGVSLVTMDVCELDVDSVRFCIMHQCSCGSRDLFGFRRSCGLACGWVSRTCAVIVNSDRVPRFANLGQCPVDCVVQSKSFRGFCRLCLQSMMVHVLWAQKSNGNAHNDFIFCSWCSLRSDYKCPTCFLFGPLPLGRGMYLRCVTSIAI